MTLHLVVLLGGLAGCREAPSERPLPPEAPETLAVTTSASDSASVAFTSFRIRNWGVDDGLLGRASDVAQTPDGYLWVTTDEGLFRFDGVRFVGFTTLNGPSFRSDDLLSVDVLAFWRPLGRLA